MPSINIDPGLANHTAIVMGAVTSTNLSNFIASPATNPLPSNLGPLHSATPVHALARYMATVLANASAYYRL